MNLHEHQAKSLLRDYGLPSPQGGVATTPEEASALAQVLGGRSWAVKAQIHAGRRKQAGGVRFAESRETVAEAARELLGRPLVTGQTGREGLLVTSVYVEKAVEIEREIYLAALVDRAAGCLTLIASPTGGEDVEAGLAAAEGLVRLSSDAGMDPEHTDFAAMAAGLGLAGEAAKAAAGVFAAVWKAFLAFDASLIELNPLAVTKSGELAVLDVKMVLDDNALFRHPELEALRDEDESDPQEREAHRFEMNYVRLDGDIGLMVTGAGLCLATIDMIKRRGGEPANFMDVRPVASGAQIAEGLGILLRSPRVRVILVNAMGGGILRCDTLAEGVAEAYRTSARKLPIVFRGAGTAKELGEMTLRNQGVPAAVFDDLGEAVDEALRLAQAGGA
ncbi:MAG: ADP-forming succinate--CoA ligase subunit beta [Kiloniellales bacterium]|nr:ADP-forming succinate--CoA ligase subunit beta [Kiloniellales bacterium]